jgi:hypothetical protein
VIFASSPVGAANGELVHLMDASIKFDYPVLSRLI